MPNINDQRLWPALSLSVLSGVLLTAGFPTLELYYVSWVALVPLLAALRGRSEKTVFLLGYLCGLVHYLSTLYWIRFVVNTYGGLSLPVAMLILFLLCAYMALYPACFALIARIFESHPLLWLIGLPSVWVTLEWMRAHAVTGFPWANLGYTQTPFSQLIQVADITGVFGVSWLVVLGNVVGTLWLRRSFVRAGSLLLAVCLTGTLFYGSWRLETVKKLEEKSSPWTVGVVQGNIDQSQKWDPAFQQETLERYRRLSLEAAKNNPRPTLLVWPETAVPFFYGIEEELTGEVNGIIGESGGPILFGSPAVGLEQGRRRLQNRAYLVNANGSLMGSYAKQHLVPFGEYVPLQKMLFFVHRLVQAAGDFAPGRDPAPLKVNSHSLGVLICYEGIFPELSRATVALGADTLVNITNDAWYGRTSAPYQHLQIERWRAVECRVPLIRAANTGISTVVDATGSMCGSIPLGEEGYLVCNVHPLRILTFYVRWGDVFAWLCVLISVTGFVYVLWKRRLSTARAQSQSVQ